MRDRARDAGGASSGNREREFFIDNLLVRIHFVILMIRWTGLAPWEFEFPFPGSHLGTAILSFTRICKIYTVRVDFCGSNFRRQSLEAKWLFPNWVEERMLRLLLLH